MLARHSAIMPKMTTVAAAFSTQTEAAVAAALQSARWNEVRDEVKEIGKLMREGTTNHSVSLPDNHLKQNVNDKLRGLHRLVENQQRNEAFAQVHTLKTMVKGQLYHHRQQQQMMAFSTAMAQRVDDFEHEMHDLNWVDVEDEVEEVRQLLHEGTTNHAINTPDIELEKLIEKSINDIKQMIEASPVQHNVIYGRIHALKGFVKERLYNGLTSKDHLVAFEKEMAALRWADVEDEVEEIRQLMQEGTTNRAVALPSQQLQKTVDEGLREIEKMMDGNMSLAVHEKVFARIHTLKSTIKAELYRK